MKRIIVPTGYMGSGSSAVTDLLSEYKGVSNDFGSYEYVFLHCPGGLFDLEDNLLIGNNAIKSDMSIRYFKERMESLYDKKFWWVGNYKKIIGTNFMKYTNDFIDNITQFKFNGYWYMHEEPNKSIIFKLMIRKPMKMLLNNKVFNKKILRYNDGMKISFVKPNEFYCFAKKYIYDVLREMSNTNENIILDQLLLPFNLFRVDNYFGEELKVIVVDRDPRDVFILNKYIWGEKKISVPFPTDANEFCKFYQKMRESEHNCSSKKVLRIHFEDLIYYYESTVEKIQKFVGFTNDDHTMIKTVFNPDISIKNTQLFNEKDIYKKEIKLIEKNLKKYLYDFPYKLNNKIENTIESDN